MKALRVILLAVVALVHDVGTAMAVQTDGKILAGHSFTGPTYDFALVRYNADGTPDSSFGNNGKVTR